MKIKITLGWFVLWGTALNAQTTIPTPPPFPGEPAIQTRAPDFSEWVVTKSVGDLSNDGSPPQPTGSSGPSNTISSQDTMTKTHHVIRIIRKDSEARLWTIWCNESQEIMIWPDGKSAEQITPSLKNFDQNPFYFDFALSDFSLFSWVSSRTYTGIQVYQGINCIVYETTLNIESDSGSPPQKVQVKAYVDLERRLPIAMAGSGYVYHYVWNPPPVSTLELPPMVKSVISRGLNAQKNMAKGAVAPF